MSGEARCAQAEQNPALDCQSSAECDDDARMTLGGRLFRSQGGDQPTWHQHGENGAPDPKRSLYLLRLA
jgi:hypothetical protein